MLLKNLSEVQQDEFAEGVLGSIPLGRFGTPDEIASAAPYLTSDDSSYITGTEIQIDGGMIQV